MKHSIDFFRDEIRYGFYVPSAVKQAWACLLDVLFEIDRICKKYDITYFADWGTILGAIRHGGFVPWDDDLDICMLRDDYMRFREVADKELPEGYCIHDFERKENHWLFLSRVVSNSRICFDEKYLDGNYNFPWLSAVDIFVKDYLYKDPEKEKQRCDDILRLLAEAEPYLNSDRKKAVALYKKAKERMSEVPPSEADEIGQIFPWILKGLKGEPKEYYEKVTYLPYEDTLIPVPACYNKVLSGRYGDYNRIIKGVAGHGYPAFEEQRKAFEHDTGAKLPRFSFDEKMLERPAADRSNSIKELAKECMEGLEQLSNAEFSLQTLQDMQDLAVNLGAMLENCKGAENEHVKAIVRSLEEYCEAIFECSQVISCNYDSSLTENSVTLSNCAIEMDASFESALKKINNQFILCKSALNEHLISRKEVLFLPVGPREWYGFEETFRKESASTDTDVFVVPLPLMLKDYYGRVKMSDKEIIAAEQLSEYPAYLADYLSEFTSFDLSLHCPDKIYIQSPYDAENPVLTIPPYYYAQNLRIFTDELIYIPIGKTAEFTEKDMPDQICMGYYVTAPGVIYADKVLLQSENIRTQYLNKLLEFCKYEGCTNISDNRLSEYWNNKLISDESIYSKANYLHVLEGQPDFSSSSDTFSDASDNANLKHLLYCVASYEYFEYKDTFESAITSRISTLKEASEKLSFDILAYPTRPAHTEDFYDEFYNTLTRACSDKGISVLSTNDAPIPLSAIAYNYDAYYGSSTPLVHEFVAQKKPVMIANYEL